MSGQRRIPADTDLAEIFPYSRAVKIANIIEICGTGAYDSAGNIVGDGDVYTQSQHIYRIIEENLFEFGATPKDVAKLTVFVTDISRWQEVAKAHREFFSETAPAVTVVEVSALMASEMLVEIEATAILDE